MSKNNRVLLADDEFHIRLMISSSLKAIGVAVVGEAKNGEEAIRLFRELQPDLMLLDINMPIKTGEEALRDIVAEFPQARIIMLTSMADAHTVETCLDAGAVNFIRKDCPLDEIKTAVMEALNA